MTMLYPALASAPFASEYFCPTTVGDDAAWAGPAAAKTAATAVDAIAAPHKAFEFMIHDVPCVVTQAFPRAVDRVGVHCGGGVPAP